MRTTIIPAIDIINGQCVRLSKGDYNQQTTYYNDPLDAAKQYEDIGIERLHLVDLDGAKQSQPTNLNVLEKIVEQTNLKVQFGGGIKNAQALQSVFNSGATWAICGSVAITNPELFIEWLMNFGGDKLILGADVRNGNVAINGWLNQTDVSIESAIAQFTPYGLSQVICTDISKDGMLQGPAFSLYKNLQHQFPNIKFTVSGGVSSMLDIEEVNNLKMPYAIIGKAIYEQKISLDNIKKWIKNE